MAFVFVTLQKNHTSETVQIPPLDRRMMWFDFRATLYIYLDLTCDIYIGEKEAFFLSTGQKQEPVVFYCFVLFRCKMVRYGSGKNKNKKIWIFLKAKSKLVFSVFMIEEQMRKNLLPT